MNLDALEDLIKARKPKGLANWKKLESLSDRLEGKQASHIMFTTSYPGQEGAKKYLGSSSGNLHFLLGYVNPAFHVAPYHWQIVDPNLTDAEAKAKEHPANPRYWEEAGLEIEDEGDIDEGKPHPAANTAPNSKARRAAKKTDAVTVSSGYGKYVGLPKEGKVYSLTNGHIYDWRIVRESYLSATSPELAEAMDDEYEEGPGEIEKATLLSLAEPIQPFDSRVYPLVKSLYPKPGSVIPASFGYVLVKSNHLRFFSHEGERLTLRVFDRDYETFDLTKSGDVHPSILLRFTENYLGVSRESLRHLVHDQAELPQFVKGVPSPGFEDVAKAFERVVTVEGNTVRVVPVVKDAK